MPLIRRHSVPCLLLDQTRSTAISKRLKRSVYWRQSLAFERHQIRPPIRWVAALFLVGLFAGCATVEPTPTTPPVEPEVRSAVLGPRGAINEDVTQANIQQTICVPGWAATVRPSTSYTNGVKAKLLREQGLPQADAARYELDHLIPLALGGHPRKPENLWLQPWDGEWSARVKDRLEVKLKAMVCRGAMSLERARRAIAVDWIAAFKSYVGAGDVGVELLEPVE